MASGWESIGEEKLTWTSTDKKSHQITLTVTQLTWTATTCSQHIPQLQLLSFCFQTLPSQTDQQILPMVELQTSNFPLPTAPEALHWVLQCPLQRTRNWENQVANHLACLACNEAWVKMCFEVNIISTNCIHISQINSSWNRLMIDVWSIKTCWTAVKKWNLRKHVFHTFQVHFKAGNILTPTTTVPPKMGPRQSFRGLEFSQRRWILFPKISLLLSNLWQLRCWSAQNCLQKSDFPAQVTIFSFFAGGSRFLISQSLNSWRFAALISIYLLLSSSEPLNQKVLNCLSCCKTITACIFRRVPVNRILEQNTIFRF